MNFKRTLGTAVLIAGVVASLAAPASAQLPLPPTLRTEKVYFHCAGATKLQNISLVQSQKPSWNTTAPTQSLQQGAGCLYYDNILSGGINGNADAIWAGTFTGNLDHFNAELHRVGDGVTIPDTVVVTLTIDGVVRYDGDVAAARTTGSGNSHVLSFGFKNINLDREPGDGTTEHTIELVVASYNETQSGWVFDASDAAAGLLINPLKPMAGAIGV